jgi:hypothetical protein
VIWKSEVWVGKEANAEGVEAEAGVATVDEVGGAREINFRLDASVLWSHTNK